MGYKKEKRKKKKVGDRESAVDIDRDVALDTGMNEDIGANSTVSFLPYSPSLSSPSSPASFFTSSVETQSIYYQQLSNSSVFFTLSPPGFGLDVHRTWEALYLGLIPIVWKSPLLKIYEGRIYKYIHI